MCGICGLYSPDGKVDSNLLERMKEVLRHRGPDDHGTFVKDKVGLGMRRLSIIDLEGGHQPMSNEDETLWLVCNGEIYNSPDLRPELEKRGHRFRTRSDVEVILHLYEEQGDGLVARLNGMFAFALWDSKKERLLLVRDRLGIKPLYYMRADDGKLRFASEIKSILQDDGIKREVDLEAAIDYLTFLNIYGGKTLFRGIRSLLPGNLMSVKDGKADVREYWDLRFDMSRESAAILAERYERLLNNSVKMQLMSDVPVGSHLSGGIDSSSLVVTARKYTEDLSTFSIVFEDKSCDESPFVREVVDMAKTKHHEVLFRAEDFFRLLPRVIWHIDEPKIGYSVVSQYVLSDLISKHVKVTFTGHGGDELFGGYPNYLLYYLKDMLDRLDLREGFRFLSHLVERARSEGYARIFALPFYALVREELRKYGRDPVFAPHERRRLFSGTIAALDRRYSAADCLQAYRSRVESVGDPLAKISYIDVKTYLVGLLELEDKLSMAHSVEDRVPILDHNIAEFSATLPTSMKVRGLSLKYIPRLAAAKLLPGRILSHRKIGFQLPLRRWFRNELRGRMERILLADRTAARGYFTPDQVGKLVRAHASGRKDNTLKLWALINFELWHRIFIDRERIEDVVKDVEG